MIRPISKGTPRYVEKLIAKREAAYALRNAIARVKRREGGKCRACGKRGSQAHHIVYRSQGGSDDPSNLVWLCDFHHRAIHSRVLKIYGADANKRLTFEWHHDAREAGLR